MFSTMFLLSVEVRKSVVRKCFLYLATEMRDERVGLYDRVAGVFAFVFRGIPFGVVHVCAGQIGLFKPRVEQNAVRQNRASKVRVV